MFGQTTRRQFLLESTAATLGLACATHVAKAEDKKPYGDLRVGVQSYSFRHFDTEPALKRTQELGLHFVELYSKHIPLTASSEQIAALKTLARSYDIKPIAFGVHPFTKNHDINRKAFEFGKALGIETLTADPDPESFDSLDKLCEEYKISIGIHPHGPTGRGGLHRWYSAEVIMKAVKDHHPLIGTCLDTGHLIRSAQLGKNLDPATEIRTMGARNFAIHLKDHDNTRKEDVVYGKGALDVPSILKALKYIHFKGYISVEYEANEANPSPDMRACLDVLQQAVKDVG